MKQCSCCKETFSLDTFCKHKRAKDGLNSICRSCHSIKTKLWKANNKAKVKADAATYRLKNKDKAKEYSVQWRADNADKIKADNRAHHVMKTFGVSMEVYDERMSKHTSCQICESKDRLVYDHAHNKTKDFRGVLCSSCNSGIGFLGDSAEGIKRAINYLNKF